MAVSKNGRFAYVNNELSSTVCVFDLEQGKEPPVLQEISTLPEGTDGSKNSTAEIELAASGRFLYVSNRGHDSIAVFTVEPETGKLSLIQNMPCGGSHPRFFALDPTGAYLLSCNMLANNIVVFAVDPPTGKLSPTESSVKVGRPACLVFVP